MAKIIEEVSKLFDDTMTESEIISEIRKVMLIGDEKAYYVPNAHFIKII